MITQLRPRTFLVRTIADLLGSGDEKRGRQHAAVLAGVSKDVIDKACVDRDLTTGANVSLIARAGKITGNFALDDIVNELASHFVPPRRRLIFQDLVDEYERSIGQSKLFLEALQNGGRLTPVVVTESCPTCDGPIEFIKICAGCARKR
jgi:hypothetical protein